MPKSNGGDMQYKQTGGLPKYAVHLDFHTMPSIYDVGRDFNAKEFAQTLSKAKVDYITVFARCNLGFAYYPTKIGTVHPGMVCEDMLGEMVSACHEQGIRVAAYFNAGIDHEHALHHREWCKVNKQGQVYNYAEMGHWFRNPCLNTGYGDHLLSMIEEVLALYPVDGLFLDCFDMSACYGIECLEGMQALGLDPFDEKQAAEYTILSTDKYIEEVKDRVNRLASGINLFLNGIPYRKQPTHIELEVLPNGGWGYDYLPFAVRYVRTLNKPYLVQTGRFHEGWGDMGGLRTEQSLLFDCYSAIANGAACGIGDHMHPRGRLEPAVYNLIGRVYSKIGTLAPWTTNVRAETEVLVIYPSLSVFPSTNLTIAEIDKKFSAIRGVARMLSELKVQFDISDGEGDISGYKSIVLPDNIYLHGKLKDGIKKHLQSGGGIISSGFSGLNEDGSGFALDEYNLSCEGEEPHNMGFFQVVPKVSKDLPPMLTTIYSPGIVMQVKPGAEVLARLHKPYFNKQSWNWHHENLYIPPEADSGRPALAKCGNIYHFSFPIFSAYFEHAPVTYKHLVRNCIEMILPKPLVKVKGMPSFGQVTVTGNGNRRMVHLLTYLPELRGQVQIIEEPISAVNIEVSLRLNGCRIKSIYLAPERKILEWQNDGDYATVLVPEVKGYVMLVFEIE